MRRALLASMAILASVAGAQKLSSYQVMAPATPGGGYDSFARAIASSLQTTGLTGSNSVINYPGDGGVKGLREFSRGSDPDRLIVFGPTTLAALQTTPSPGVSLEAVTPVARMITDSEVLLVPASSPYRTVDDLAKAAASSTLRFGGASIGSIDHMFIAMILKAKGVPLENLKWIPSSGNLQAGNAMNAGELDAISVAAGIATDLVKAGKARALLVSGPKRIIGIPAPTATDAGIEAEITNWRGVFAPGDLSAAQVSELNRKLYRLQSSSAWTSYLRGERVSSGYMAPVDFAPFVKKEQARITKLLQELGLK